MLQQYGQKDVQIEQEQQTNGGFFKLKNITIRQRLFEGGWSSAFDREICVRGDAVGVLLYDPKLNRLALVEQLRVGVLGREESPWLLEIVAGMMDQNAESEEQVVHREAMEEAGLRIAALEPIIRYYSSPGGSTEALSLFCGKTDLSQTQGGVFGLDEENEDIRLHILAVDDVLALLAQGKINNAMTIIALQWFQLNQSRLDALWHD